MKAERANIMDAIELLEYLAAALVATVAMQSVAAWLVG